MIPNFRYVEKTRPPHLVSFLGCFGVCFSCKCPCLVPHAPHCDSFPLVGWLGGLAITRFKFPHYSTRLPMRAEVGMCVAQTQRGRTYRGISSRPRLDTPSHSSRVYDSWTVQCLSHAAATPCDHCVPGGTALIAQPNIGASGCVP